MTVLRRFWFRVIRSRSGSATFWGLLNVVEATVVGMITARVLGVSARGTLAVLLSVAALTVLFGVVGTNVSIRRRLPRLLTGVKQYFRVSAVLFCIYMALLPLVILALRSWVDSSFGDWAVAGALVAYGAVLFWSNQLLDLLNALGKVPLSAAINAGGTAVCLACVTVAGSTGGGLVAMAISYAVAMCAQIAFASAMAKKYWPRGGDVAGGGGGLLLDGAMVMGLNVGQTITYRAGTILIGALSSVQAVGLYAVATTPAGLLRLPATAVGQVLFHDVAVGSTGLRHVWKRAARVQAVLVVAATIGWLVAEPAIVFVYGNDFAEAAGIFRILLIAELCLSPFLVFSRVLVGAGGTWQASISGILGAVALIAAGVMLIPEYGAYGGAWASVAAYALMSVVSTFQVLVMLRTGGESSAPA